MITLLLNTVKEMSTVNTTQTYAKHRPIFTCKNETKANNISNITTKQSEKREASISPSMTVQKRIAKHKKYHYPSN